MRILLIACILFLSSCSYQQSKAIPTIKHATCVIQPTLNYKTTGIVTFTQKGKLVDISVDLQGLSPHQKHGFHIHEFGDISDPKGLSAGGHYNPKALPHALPPTKARHAGSFGNLKADKTGHAKLQFLDDTISVAGDYHPIIGRSLIIHRDADKGTQPTGGAGPRIGMCVIGIAK